MRGRARASGGDAVTVARLLLALCITMRERQPLAAARCYRRLQQAQIAKREDAIHKKATIYNKIKAVSETARERA